MSDPIEPLRVLVVDDDKLALRAAHEQAAKFGDRIQISEASTVSEAVSLVRARFHHLAFVDLELPTRAGRLDAGGKDVLQCLLEEARSCRRVLITRHATNYVDSIVTVFRPDNPLADAIVPKEFGKQWYVSELANGLKRLAERETSFQGLDEVVARIVEQRGRLGIGRRLSTAHTTNSEQIEAEVRALLSDLFAGTVGIEHMGATRLHLNVIESGLSAACVAELIPELGSDEANNPVIGNRCVVKIGRRESIHEEVARFQSFVRFGVALDNRVEMLGASASDNLGAVCYSFAGGNESQATTLDAAIDRFDPIDDSENNAKAEPARQAIDQLFDVSNRRWYEVVGPRAPIGSYFEEKLRSRFSERLQTIHEWARWIA